MLDGQQRLTSLLIGLNGTYETKIKNARKANVHSWVKEALYINLLHNQEHADEIDDDDRVLQELYYEFQFADDERGPRNSSTKIWFRVSDIMRLRTPVQLEAETRQILSSHPGLGDNDHETVRDILTRLHKMVWKNNCIASYLEHDQSYDKVLDTLFARTMGVRNLVKAIC